MRRPLNAQQLDAAWNAYVAADEARHDAFQALIDALVSGGDVAAARQAHAHAVAAERQAAQAIRGAQADVLTVLSLRLSEVGELARGLQIEAGLAEAVHDLAERISALERGRRLTEGERE